MNFLSAGKTTDSASAHRSIFVTKDQKQATTDGLKEARGVSGAPGGRDEIHTLSINRRWIPPSVLQRKDAFSPNSSRARATSESRNDSIFRNVRSILNKLTPENFHKLSDDLLQIDLNSSVILKGVILLIFEKALDEPKYSSMYARLCKRLSIEAPNFEQPSEPCTFRLLLLNKCRDEFENRSKANDAFSQKERSLGPDEEERRQNAKRKMLGNIQFIGELGKLDVLGEGNLHKCIRELLHGKNIKLDREDGHSDITEDLEFLCQIMRTCGNTLDIKGKNLMDQYFQRMILLSENPTMPIRIRFMLRDVIELRMCGWIPREATSTEGPKPMHQIQIQADNSRGSNKSNQSHMNSIMQNDHAPSYNRPNRGGMDYGGMGNYKNTQNGDFNYYPHRQFQDQGGYNSNKQNNFQRNNGPQNYGHNTGNSGGQGQDFNKSGYKNDLPPNFTEKIKLVNQQSMNLDDLSLRPPPQSFRRGGGAKPSMTGAMGGQNNGGKPLTSMGQQVYKDPPVMLKQTSFDMSKAVKKEVKPVVKEITVESLMEDYNKHGKLQDAEVKIPDKLIRPLLQAVMVQSLGKAENDRENARSLIAQVLKKPSPATSGHFLESYRNLMSQLEGKADDEIPDIQSNIAGFAAHAITEGIVSLAKISEFTENGENFPLFLVVLLQLHQSQGEAKVKQLFDDSKVNLLKQLPEANRNKEYLVKVLDDRNLGFLLPLLGIQTELWKQLEVDSNPTVFYKWIKENINTVHHTNPEFVNGLMTVVLKYIVLESTQLPEIDVVAIQDKAFFEKERALLDKFKVVLQAFINERVKLQVSVLYALQTFCHSLDFPKGLLLRWFINLYELEVVEEEAFLNWKEDVTDTYPGKGNALFQVNQWLTWLEYAESEGEDDN